MSDLDKIKVLGWCNPPCPERRDALYEDTFGPARVLGGWVFREGPFRHLDDNAKYRARYYGLPEPEDHSGEHYVFTSCPWCGRDLPAPPDDDGLEGHDDEC